MGSGGKLNKPKKEFFKRRAEKLIKVLAKNNIKGFYFETSSEARSKLLSLIPENVLIGFGGSMTLKEIGLLEELREGRYNILDRFKSDISKEEKWGLQRQALLADIFITGTNAVTMKGELINMDHSGNRVAGMLFGPNKVFIIIGINKIVQDLDEGIKRVKKYASPMNAIKAQGEYHPPCIQTGECNDCSSDERICNSLVIINRQYKANRMIIFIVGEPLGF